MIKNLIKGMRVVVPAQDFMGNVTPQQAGVIVDFPADAAKALRTAIALVQLDSDPEPRQYFVRQLRPVE